MKIAREKFIQYRIAKENRIHFKLQLINEDASFKQFLNTKSFRTCENILIKHGHIFGQALSPIAD